jgi:hypothetical protein
MAEVLSQDQLDQMFILDDLLVDFASFPSKKETIEDFEAFLTERKFEPEKKYGMFDKDITMCRLFESKDGETVLADIERKNAKQNMGNIAIPNINIKLINYLVCTKCKTFFIQ